MSAGVGGVEIDSLIPGPSPEWEKGVLVVGPEAEPYRLEP